VTTRPVTRASGASAIRVGESAPPEAGGREVRDAVRVVVFTSAEDVSGTSASSGSDSKRKFPRASVLATNARSIGVPRASDPTAGKR
jgi:hypothetical protein